jgi:integrase
MSVLPSHSAIQPATIKLFAGDANHSPTGAPGKRSGAPGLSPRMTLAQFYWAFYRPMVLVAKGAEKRTLDAYDQSIRYWQELTEDPPLEDIDDFHIGGFLTVLAALPGQRPRGRKDAPALSPNTIRKHCTHLQAVVYRAGPRSHERNRRKGQGLIDSIPYFEKPSEREKLPEDDFSIPEITLLLANCDASPSPTYLAPAERAIWWQNLFVFDFNVGLRIGSLTLVEWDRIKLDPKKGTWWVTVRAKGGNEKKSFVNKFAMARLEAMRPLTGQYPHVFHFPHTHSWLQECRRRIMQKAGLPEERRFGFHGLRKAMCTEGSEIDPLAAQMQAGHSDFKMTQTRYINPSRVASAMSRLPQPTLPGNQKRLFE